MAPLIGARDRFTPWVACERSGMAPLIGARDRFTPWVACERSRMAPLELAALGVVEARERIGRGTLSPVALVEACLERIGALDATVQAWVHVDAKGALAAARLAEHAAVRGPLHGIPVAVKDIFDVAGLPTTAGAPPFAHRRPDEDAASVALLRAAGAIVLGKTHTTQFAYRDPAPTRDRKSTRLNSSHGYISYAVFCLKKKKKHKVKEKLYCRRCSCTTLTDRHDP